MGNKKFNNGGGCEVNNCEDKNKDEPHSQEGFEPATVSSSAIKAPRYGSLVAAGADPIKKFQRKI